jgi:protein-disulfide isomerase-like protein with CxxC motif
MLLQPFLTDLDSRAAIKGSRDPLGVQQIWTRLGRHVVGNLTTVSTQLRDFTTLLLGYHFAERVSEERGGEGDLATFLKWEQLAGYARWGINKERFRGIERVQKNLEEGPRVRISADASAQILGNQKIYGLWGLYTVPARSSGLVEGDPTRLTAPARQLVEQVYLPALTKAGFRNGDAIAARLRERQSVLDTGNRDRALLDAVAKLLRRRVLSSEHAIYRAHLLLGGPADRTDGLQQLLANLLSETLRDSEWALSARRVRQLARAAQAHGELGERLADRLERIRCCELLLAPAVSLFGYLIGSDGQSLQSIAEKIGTHWGALPTIELDRLGLIERDLNDALGDAEATARWLDLAQQLAAGDYQGAISTLIEHNAAVMKARSGAAPWVRLRGDNLEVLFREEQPSPLPKREELREHWLHPYFIESLRTMAAQLRE